MGCAYCTLLSTHHVAASKGSPEFTLKCRAKPIPCGGAPSSNVVQPHPRCAPAVLGARRRVVPALEQGGGSHHTSSGKRRPQLDAPNTAPVPHPWFRNKRSTKAKASVQWVRLSPAIFCCPHHGPLRACTFICSRALSAAGGPAGLTHGAWKLPHGCMRPRQRSTHLPPQLPSREAPVHPPGCTA